MQTGRRRGTVNPERRGRREQKSAKECKREQKRAIGEGSEGTRSGSEAEEGLEGLSSQKQAERPESGHGKEQIIHSTTKKQHVHIRQCTCMHGCMHVQSARVQCGLLCGREWNARSGSVPIAHCSVLTAQWSARSGQCAARSAQWREGPVADCSAHGEECWTWKSNIECQCIVLTGQVQGPGPKPRAPAPSQSRGSAAGSLRRPVLEGGSHGAARAPPRMSPVSMVLVCLVGIANCCGRTETLKCYRSALRTLHTLGRRLVQLLPFVDSSHRR